MLEISRTKRVFGAIVNSITFFGLLIGNLILLLAAGKTVGGIVLGYKYDKNGGAMFVLLLTKMLSWFLAGVTLSIFWWIDVIGMGGRDGTFAEKWAGVKKVQNK